jgi:polyhydroxybutyrate depolymerase
MKKTFRYGLIMCFALIFAGQNGAWAAETVAKSLIQGDKTRTYQLYVPDGLDRKKASPLVLVLHGRGGSGEDMVKVTGSQFSRSADAEKFIVAYPDSYGKLWNDPEDNVDDKAFMLAIVEAVKTEIPVDMARIYIAGLSNGGMMAQGMACEFPEKFAAAATVAGTLPDFQVSKCASAKPVSMMVIHGTADPIIPFAGGLVSVHADNVNVLSARQTAELWANNGKCQLTPRVFSEPNKDPEDGTTVQREIYAGCSGKIEVDLIIVEGGGHTWPGGFQYMPERFIGKTSREIDAGRIIWNFFKRFAI